MKIRTMFLRSLVFRRGIKYEIILKFQITLKGVYCFLQDPLTRNEYLVYNEPKETPLSENEGIFVHISYVID